MGGDLAADDRATHGVEPSQLEATRASLAAEVADLERERAGAFAVGSPERNGVLRRKREELANVDKAIAATTARFVPRRLVELGVDWLDKPPPPVPALLTVADGSPFVRSGIVASLLAAGGTGKTFALTQLAVSLASGARWLDTYKPTEPGAVFLGMAEEDVDEVRRRLYQATRPLSPEQRAMVMRNVAAEGFAGRDVAFLRRTPDRDVGKAGWFDTFKAGLVEGGPWRCIILDPWSRWGGVDAETDAHAATTGVRLLESLTTLPGNPTVFVAHHTRKPSKGQDAPDANDARGSSAFVDGGRCTLSLWRRPDELLSLRVTKTNGTVYAPELILTRATGGTLRPATPAEIAAARPPETTSPRARGRPPGNPPRTGPAVDTPPMTSSQRFPGDWG